MTMKNDEKFEEELTCCFKIDMRNLTDFDQSTQKSQKFALQWAPFDQVYVWVKKVQRSYLSWHWRVMPNLKKNWLVVWKKTWRIWQIFTRGIWQILKFSK